MRQSLVLISLIVVLVVVPATASAQALFGKKCKDDPNRVYLTGAWVHSFDTHYTLEQTTPWFFIDGTPLVYSYNYDAFQAGVGFPLVLGDEGKFGSLLLGGTVTIPSSTTKAECSDYLTNGVLFRANKWTADTYYATVEGIWAYPVYAGWSALAGFRWVYWQTSYKKPTDSINFVRWNSDAGDVTINGYIPLLGIMTSMQGLSAGVVFFPTTLGTVEHKENVLGGRFEVKGDFTGGYFTEIFLDYTMPAFEMPGMKAGLSVFGKVSFLRATSTAQLTDYSPFPAVTHDFDFALQRNLLFLGAKATFDFDLPDWPSTRILYY